MPSDSKRYTYKLIIIIICNKKSYANKCKCRAKIIFLLYEALENNLWAIIINIGKTFV